MNIPPIFPPEAILLVTLLTLAVACNQPSYDGKVHHAGSMKQIMRGNIAPVKMSDSLNFDHLYALGALGRLKGEVLVWDGNPYVARMNNGRMFVSQSQDFDAALWVSAQVPRWQQVHLASLPIEDRFIDVIMAKSAEQKGWDGESPFPFRLEGTFEKLAYHVVDWPEGDTVHTPEKHRSTGFTDTLYNIEAQVLGFYSEKHQGIFTHHGRNVHMHFRTKSGKIAGHVDHFQPGTELTMYLPQEFN